MWLALQFWGIVLAALHVQSSGLFLTKAVVDAGDRVTLSTPQGQIVIRLRTDAAPRSSAIFSKLVRSGLYNGCSFYRAEDFCIQGGLRTAAGEVRKNPYGHFPFEYGLPNKRGTVTLARWEDVNSATGEFFINLKDSPHLDRTGTTGWSKGFAVFGEVESGMDVAEKIAALPTQNQGGMSMLATPVSFQAAVGALSAAAPVPPIVQTFSSRSSNMIISIASIGKLPVRLLPSNAPNIVSILTKLAQIGASGNLHRAEGIPVAPSQGPPYALVQATLRDSNGELAKAAHEGSLPITRGSVCLIPGSSDVFISLGEHAGWENSMTVVGEVAAQDLAQFVLPILQLPHHNVKHPTFGTIMSMLDAPLPIQMSVVGAKTPNPANRMQPTSNAESLRQAATITDPEELKVRDAEAVSEQIEEQAGIMLRGFEA